MENYPRLISVIFIAFGIFAMVAEAGNLYRYRNSEGNLVIDYAVPPEYVASGYEVLSDSGTLIDVVEPQADPEDKESGEVQQSRSELDTAQKKQDEMLLRTYSEIAELESAMERKLAQLDREVEIIQANLEKNTQALNASRAGAANYQMGGRNVPKALLKNMNIQMHEQLDGEKMLQVRHREYEDTKARYMGYLDRLKTLKGINKDHGEKMKRETDAGAASP